MHKRVNLPISLLQSRKELVNLLFFGHITLESLGTGKGLNQILCLQGKPLVLISDGELRASRVQGLRNRPRDAAFISDSKHNRHPAFKIGRHNVLRRGLWKRKGYQLCRESVSTSAISNWQIANCPLNTNKLEIGNR